MTTHVGIMVNNAGQLILGVPRASWLNFANRPDFLEDINFFSSGDWSDFVGLQGTAGQMIAQEIWNTYIQTLAIDPSWVLADIVLATALVDVNDNWGQVSYVVMPGTVNVYPDTYIAPMIAAPAQVGVDINGDGIPDFYVDAGQGLVQVEYLGSFYNVDTGY